MNIMALCFRNIFFLLSLTLLFSRQSVVALDGGALGGERYRVLISSDIGGGDDDDFQSMVHYLVYADLFDTEGLVSSPPQKGRKKDILKVIDLYEKDYPNLKRHSESYPTPAFLRSISKQGAIDPAPGKGYSNPTEGSRWIIHCAKKKDPRPLYVLVRGSITDVAQALHDDPTIKDKIRVHFISSWNRKQDPNSFRYIDQHHPDTWLIHNDTTFRGWYTGSHQKGEWGNAAFVQKNVKGHGRLGDFFAPLKDGKIKMGDTPTVSYLLRGTPDDPTKESWGGRFVRRKDRPHWWEDDPNPALAEAGNAGAKTINKWREFYLCDWRDRMDRCLEPVFVPFVIPARPNPDSAIAFAHEAIPVGGPRLVTKNAHFSYGGERLRLWGVNFSFGASLPTREDAPIVAARLAASGVNTVRIHHLDSAPYPRGIWNAKDGKNFEPEALANLDYFIDQLARYGIFVNFNLHVGRAHSRYLGLPDPKTKYDKVVGIFTPQLIDAQKRYAHDILTRVNPHRGLRYADDPAIGFVEITNEDSFFMWNGEESLRNLPGYYEKILRELYCDWLKKKYGSSESLDRAWSEGGRELGEDLLQPVDSGQKKGAPSPISLWKIEQHEGCKASLSHASPGNLNVNIQKIDSQDWHLQVRQEGFKIKEGQYYSVLLSAWSPKPRTISCSLLQAHDPWKSLGLSRQMKLTPEKKAFRFGFVARQGDENSRIRFAFGDDSTPFTLANIELRPGGREGLRGDESLEKGNIVLFAESETPTRERDRMRFLAETEKGYFDGLKSYIQNDLGCKALVTGTIVFGPLGLYAQSDMDFIDSHAYWQHPSFPGKPWDSGNWIIRQKAMTDHPDEATLFRLAANRLAGKPYTVSEYNHPAPNDYQAETVPMLSSFAAAHNWDALWLYTYSHDADFNKNGHFGSYFDLHANPAKWGFMTAGAVIFRQGVVAPQPSEKPIFLGGDGDLLEGLTALHLKHGSDMFAALAEKGKFDRDGLLKERYLASFAPVATPAVEENISRNRTRLHWWLGPEKKGVFQANNQAGSTVTGWGHKINLMDCGVDIQSPAFVSLTFTILDGRTGAETSKMLVTACGRVENTGMEFSKDRQTVGRNWGSPPARIEAVLGTVDLRNGPWKCQALGPDGVPTQEVPPMKMHGRSVLTMSPKYRTMWYLLTRDEGQ